MIKKQLTGKRVYDSIKKLSQKTAACTLKIEHLEKRF